MSRPLTDQEKAEQPQKHAAPVFQYHKERHPGSRPAHGLYHLRTLCRHEDTACVDVCPVDCIHPRKDEPEFATSEMLYIHPDECIDCGACVPACPVDAIFALDETPAQWQAFIGRNSEYFRN